MADEGIMFYGDSILFDGDAIVFDCPDECCGGFTPGDDCPTFCQTGTTPAAFDLTFTGVADGTCTGNAAYYNSTTFHFVQNPVSPCQFQTATTLLGGPCTGLGVCDITFVSGKVKFVLGNPTPMTMETAHTNGTSCQGPYTLPFVSQAGGPPPVLDFSGASCTITPVAP